MGWLQGREGSRPALSLRDHSRADTNPTNSNNIFKVALLACRPPAKAIPMLTREKLSHQWKVDQVSTGQSLLYGPTHTPLESNVRSAAKNNALNHCQNKTKDQGL